MKSKSSSTSSTEGYYPTTFKESRSCLVDDVPQKEDGSCWGRKSSVEKKLWVLVFILLLNCSLFAATFAYLFITYRAHHGIFMPQQQDNASKAPTEDFSPLPTSYAALSTPEQPEGICLTPGCVTAASTIIENMDPEASPCDDFYQYACGGFEDFNYIPDSKTRTGQFSIISEDLSQQIRALIDSQEDYDQDSELLIKMKQFYNSCMNETRIRERGLKPLEDIVERLGGWPVLKGDEWNATGFSWTDLMVRCSDIHVPSGAFLGVSVAEDVVNNSRHLLTLSTGRLSLPKKYYRQGLNNTYVKTYLNYMITAAMFFGADPDTAKQDMEDVLEFEMQMSKLLRNHERISNISKLYTLTNLSHIQKTVPDVNWKDYLERIMHVQLEDDEPVYVMNENYVMNFTKILNQTNPRTLANFVVGSIVRALAPIVSEEFSQVSFRSFRKLSGVTTRAARWRLCLDRTRTVFSAAISHEYLNAWFGPEEKVKANEMVNLIKQEMHDVLSRVNWVDPKTLKRAQEKLSLMTAIVAYPDELLDYDKVAEIYENYTVSEDTYFENILNYRRLSRERHFLRLRKPVKKHDWKKDTSVAVVNAFYSPLENSIILPAGILQGVFFNYERPEYMNFASIGAVIGHEITHAFDDRGRQFDQMGRLQNWWEPETSKKFKELTQCMIDQYSRFRSPEVDMNMNGKNCIGENIADNGGIKNAYYAYQRWVQEHGREEALPGLNLTSNQLFWMSYANVWCNKVRPEALKQQIEFGSHTISRFRVIGPLSNFPEFARDFNCPINSTMNPVKRCAVW